MCDTEKSEHAMGSMASLEELNLDGNKIGDLGMNSLSQALANGSLPQCTRIRVAGNPASGETMQRVTDALKQRTAPRA